MGNPQIQRGGAGVILPVTGTGQGPSSMPAGYYVIYNAAGAVLSGSNSQPFGSTGTNGESVMAPGPAQITVQIPSNANYPVAAGDYINYNIGGSYYSAVFDVTGAAAGAPTNPVANFAAGTVTVSATARPAGENVTSYNCYRSQNGGAAVKISSNATPSFTDAAPQISAAYSRSYYITAVSAQGEGPASATVSVNIPAQTFTSNQQHLFSSGTLVANWTDSQGNPATATFATLQDITTDLGFDRKDLWDAVINSVFPIDSADSMGKLTFKIGNATISADTLQRIVAGQLATAGGTTTLTLPKTVKLPAFQAVLTLTDTRGKTITVSLNLVKGKGVSLPFKINDFVIQNFELDAYPDPVSNIIGTWSFGA